MFFPLLVLILATLSSAQTCTRLASHVTFTFGNINGTVISDGPIFADPALFPNVPEQAILRSYERNFNPAPVILDQNILILDTRDARIMVDAGAFNVDFPGFTKAGRILQALAAADISQESIDAILFTHGHFDHVAGIIDIDGRRVFPNAKLYIGRMDHSYWSVEPHVNNSPTLDDATSLFTSNVYKRSIAPYRKAGDLNLMRNNQSPFPGIKFVPSPGHSFGHMLIQVKSAGKTLLVTGDTWVSKPDQVQNPTWALFVEFNNTQAYASRLHVLEKAAKKKYLILAYHERFPGLGYVRELGPFFDWIDAPRADLGIGGPVVCDSP